jgi:hypothetical protein
MTPKIHAVLNLHSPDWPSTIQKHVFVFMNVVAQIFGKWKGTDDLCREKTR